MYSLRGIPISKGIAIGKVLIRHDMTKLIGYNSQIDPNRVDDEIAKYQRAIEKVRDEMEILKATATSSTHLKQQNIQIINYYGMLLNEDFFKENVPKRIQSDLLPADNALVQELEIIRREFEKIENEYFQSRFLDFKAVADRILRKMHGDIDLGALKEPIILIAEEISTAEVLHISREFVLGIASESGGTTSHAAIIAESLEIPAVFGIKDLLSYVKKTDQVIVDAYKGTVVVDPEKKTVQSYIHIKNTYELREKETFKVLSKPSVTTDNVDVEILANVSSNIDLSIANRYGAEGIGLFRSELAFIEQQRFLNENEQFDLYKEYLLLFQGKEVTIRTLDLGGDKFFGSSNTSRDPNPFLGWRSIRIFLKETERFKQQLRAIIRSSVFNDKVKIMIPMISSLDEIRQVKKIFKECEEDVKREGKPFKYNIPIGIMVEIPSAALMSDRLANEVDFFSIGTNDLVQYTLAVDRNNEAVAQFYQPLNPAVLILIKLTVDNAKKFHKPISVCGEIARNPLYIRLLLGMGLRKFSVNPAYVPLVKSILLKSSISETEALWKTIKTKDTAAEIEEILKHDLKKNLFDIYDSYFYTEKKDWKGLSL